MLLQVVGGRLTCNPIGTGLQVRCWVCRVYLKTSLTFSPACLMLPLAWSLWPSALRSSLPVASPALSLAFPPSSWPLSLALSIPLMCFSFRAGWLEWWRCALVGLSWLVVESVAGAPGLGEARRRVVGVLGWWAMSGGCVGGVALRVEHFGE